MTKKEFEEETGITLTKIDNDLYYNDNLDLWGRYIKTIPDNLTINGDLNLFYTNIKVLPKKLTVKGNLYLLYTSIESLPDDLNVNGRYILISNPNIDYDPDKIGFLFSKEIGSRYDITCYNIKKDFIKCGCFSGTLNEFIDRVHHIYSNSNGTYRNEYDEFIEECKHYKDKITTI